MSFAVRAGGVLSILGRSAVSRQVARRIDQPDMGEGLREVTKHPVRVGIVLLREESDIIPQAEKPFEQFPRFIVPALQCQIICEPERAQKE